MDLNKFIAIVGICAEAIREHDDPQTYPHRVMSITGIRVEWVSWSMGCRLHIQLTDQLTSFGMSLRYELVLSEQPAVNQVEVAFNGAVTRWMSLADTDNALDRIYTQLKDAVWVPWTPRK